MEVWGFTIGSALGRRWNWAQAAKERLGWQSDVSLVPELAVLGAVYEGYQGSTRDALSGLYSCCDDHHINHRLVPTPLFLMRRELWSNLVSITPNVRRSTADQKMRLSCPKRMPDVQVSYAPEGGPSADLSLKDRILGVAI